MQSTRKQQFEDNLTDEYMLVQEELQARGEFPDCLLTCPDFDFKTFLYAGVRFQTREQGCDLERLLCRKYWDQMTECKCRPSLALSIVKRFGNLPPEQVVKMGNYLLQLLELWLAPGERHQERHQKSQVDNAFRTCETGERVNHL